MEISVGCRLRYSAAEQTHFIFQILAAKADSQIVKSENLALTPNSLATGYEIYVDPITDTRKIRALLGPGPIEIVYEATVEVNTSGFDPVHVQEYDFENLPMEVLDFITPSRYCPSDIFTQFTHDIFGHIPRGHTRVTAICDWVFNNIRYQSGSTGPSTNAADVFKSREGVCRDFAHLGISLCRALGIPARYACVYADALSPQDFHAVFQAYLLGPKGGEWFSFDATRMASVDSIIRIAAGLDAANVAFAWPQAPVDSNPPQVWAEAQGRAVPQRTALAIGN
jgi:transglutaminase-like putative cysteine protease